MLKNPRTDDHEKKQSQKSQSMGIPTGRSLLRNKEPKMNIGESSVSKGKMGEGECMIQKALAKVIGHWIN